MKTIILILCAGLFTAGFAALAAMILWNWAWFRKRNQAPKVDPRMQVRLAIWRDGQKHVIF